MNGKSIKNLIVCYFAQLLSLQLCKREKIQIISLLVLMVKKKRTCIKYYAQSWVEKFAQLCSSLCISNMAAFVYHNILALTLHTKLDYSHKLLQLKKCSVILTASVYDVNKLIHRNKLPPQKNFVQKGHPFLRIFLQKQSQFSQIFGFFEHFNEFLKTDLCLRIFQLKKGDSQLRISHEHHILVCPYTSTPPAPHT